MNTSIWFTLACLAGSLAFACSSTGAGGTQGTSSGGGGHQRYPGHPRLGEGVQQLRPAPDHTIPFLPNAGQVPGYVHHHDQWHRERVRSDDSDGDVRQRDHHFPDGRGARAVLARVREDSPGLQGHL